MDVALCYQLMGWMDGSPVGVKYKAPMMLFTIDY